jgi:hypothetical protein
MGKSSKKNADNARLYAAKYLVVDSAPLLESPLASLRGMAAHYMLTTDVGTSPFTNSSVPEPY